MMMKIGKLLRKVRVELGLTQKEMAGDIVSPAQYLRIEKDEQQIKLDDLLAILQKHDYDLGLFFTRLMLQCQLRQEALLDENKDGVKKAFYGCNLDSLEKLEINPHDQILLVEAETIKQVLGQRLDKSQTSKQKICQYFIDQDNWMENLESLKLFTIVLHIFNFEMVVFWMNELLDKYRQIEKYPEQIQIAVAKICISFMIRCHQEQSEQLIKPIVAFVDSFPAYPEFAICKLVAKYYQSLSVGDTDKAEKLNFALNEAGVADFFNFWWQ
ncbi:xre family transcriptional regulator [Lactobacillus equicursoris DSM 19284 = JCM 14600 = CIP 110162]|uniref:Xre family transcriptional regulator n=2 Tax=Lactobacillaceae TaxID=33958 RepID=A0A0R1MEG2_9LACO|nr:xre family transcriptional regulator [Lactobacillus equicursoris DSM 19284 = JCM 14600 = CIP 110162]TXG06624.1 helix-turn-helix domain-containing protein [Lactobacillus delbrueckii subsp. bulgaricus]